MKTWEVVIPPMFAGIPICNRTINNQEDGDIDTNGNIINKIMKRTTKNQSEIALDIVFNSVSPYILFFNYILLLFVTLIFYYLYIHGNILQKIVKK